MITTKIIEDSILSCISLGVSILSVIFSACLFFIYDKRLKRQSIRINEFILKDHQRREEEAKKAVIAVSHTYRGNGRGVLVITNSGQSEAHNLKMVVHENKNSGIYWYFGDIFPYSRLTPGGEIKINYNLLSHYQKDPVLTFHWDDESGKDRTASHTIYLG